MRGKVDVKTSLAFTFFVSMAAIAASDDITLAPTDAVAIDLAATSVLTSRTNLCLGPASAVKDCWVGFISVTNTNASGGAAITFGAQDGQGTPFQLFGDTTSIAAGSTVIGSFQPSGMYFSGGLRVIAGASGLHLYLHAKRAK